MTSLREAREFVSDQGGLIFTARELRGLEAASQLVGVLEKTKVSTGSASAHPTAPRHR